MKTIVAFGIGTLIGGAIGVLFPPRVNDSIERATAKARELARQTAEVAAYLNDSVESIRGAVDAGVRAFNDAKTQWTH
jgi:hypothetical protein